MATDWLAIGLISTGVYLVSSGPLPHRRAVAASLS